MKKITLVFISIISIMCITCCGLKEKEGKNNETVWQKSNELFDEMSDIKEVYTYNYVGEKLYSKNEDDIENIVYLLKSISLDKCDVQLQADGQFWIRLIQEGGNYVDIIAASDYISINGECYITKDTDKVQQIESIAMKFGKK